MIGAGCKLLIGKRRYLKIPVIVKVDAFTFDRLIFELR